MEKGLKISGIALLASLSSSMLSNCLTSIASPSISIEARCQGDLDYAHFNTTAEAKLGNDPSTDVISLLAYPTQWLETKTLNFLYCDDKPNYAFR